MRRHFHGRAYLEQHSFKEEITLICILTVLGKIYLYGWTVLKFCVQYGSAECYSGYQLLIIRKQFKSQKGGEECLKTFLLFYFSVEL